ncbi:MAG: SprT-like domain-containing protein [Cellulomonas sp.]|nr:SprT-like domain-containing protein [Cellulomonas sp.]
MSLPPDDLPRSPTGRVPQWVLDEAAGRVEPQQAWRSGPSLLAGPPQPRRRSGRVRRVALVLVLLVGLATVASVYGGDRIEALSARIAAAARGGAPLAPPSAEVVALADDAHLSDEGRSVLYAASPQVLDAADFVGRCTQAEWRIRAGTAVGCYLGAEGSIVLYRPADPRLHPFVVETAAHEMLHAAYAGLTAADQALIGPLLEAELATLPADAQVRSQIDSSVGSHPENRETELFAYLGTQDPGTGGALAPELEAVYARFIADRQALVAVHAGWTSMLSTMATDVHASMGALQTRMDGAAQVRAQLDADVRQVDAAQAELDAWTATYAATAADERAGRRLSITWWDGTVLPMAPADQTLAAASGLLARDRQAIADRRTAADAEDAAVEAERARVVALDADLVELNAELAPSA